MTPSEIQTLLEKGGVDAVILEVFGRSEKGIALLRLHHACENTESTVSSVAEWIALALGRDGIWNDVITESAATAAIKLRILANEIEKSIPVLREAHAEETPGLRREGPRPAPETGPGRPSDWDDVPF